MWLGIVGVVVGSIWVILHYTTKWKQAPKITQEDEKLLDELYTLARRLEDRVTTVERIVAVDNPDFRPGLTRLPRRHPGVAALLDRSEELMPGSRTRFYLDKQNEKVKGVCAGIADYTGIDVTIVRVALVVLAVATSGWVILAYIAAAWLAPGKPLDRYGSADDARFWQGVRANPTRSTAEP